MSDNRHACRGSGNGRHRTGSGLGSSAGIEPRFGVGGGTEYADTLAKDLLLILDKEGNPSRSRGCAPRNGLRATAQGMSEADACDE